MNKCGDIPVNTDIFECGDERLELPLELRRQYMEREKWIRNVIRVLGYERRDAENAFIKIQSSKTPMIL